MERPHKNIPKSILRLILKELIKEGFDHDDMSEMYESNSIMDRLDSLVKKFGIEINEYEDYGFYSELFKENVHIKGNEYHIDEELIIPQLKKFNVYFRVQSKKWFNESWELPIKSYGEEYVKEMIYNGDYSYYDGTMYDDDITDSETDDWNITDITQSGIVENTKTKKIIKENKDIIEKELKELQKLKLIIDERIKLLTP